MASTARDRLGRYPGNGEQVRRALILLDLFQMGSDRVAVRLFEDSILSDDYWTQRNANEVTITKIELETNWRRPIMDGFTPMAGLSIPSSESASISPKAATINQGIRVREARRETIARLKRWYAIVRLPVCKRAAMGGGVFSCRCSRRR